MTPISRRSFGLLSAASAADLALPGAGLSVPQARRPAAARGASDPHRPQYHLLPPANWMNDAMGIYWKGEYHIFYLHNPEAPVWRRDKHWGHAVSDDLIHWRHLPVVLGPEPGGPEKLCCQTGSLVADGETPTAIYTCAPGVCIATSADGLKSWRRYPGNPVIPGAPEGLEVTGFRDPSVWREGEFWYLLMASGTAAAGGTVLLYRSPDLRRWEYLHPLLEGEGGRDTVWEVPGLFRLGGKAVLLYSPTKESTFTRYFVGDYRDQRFHVEGRGKLDLGVYYYAATTFEAPPARRIAIAWLKEGRSGETVVRAGWSGCLSLPRVLALGPDGRVVSEPVPEVRTLRGEHRQLESRELTGDVSVPGVEGNSLELIAEFEPGDAGTVGAKVLCSPEGDEQTTVGYDARAGSLFVDATQASQDAEADNKRAGGAVRLERPGRVRFRIFVDHSVVEVFAGGSAITARVYPTRKQSRAVRLFATGGRARLVAFDAWKMKPFARG